MLLEMYELILFLIQLWFYAFNLIIFLFQNHIELMSVRFFVVFESVNPRFECSNVVHLQSEFLLQEHILTLECIELVL